MKRDMMRKGESNYKPEEKGLSECIQEPDRSEFKPHQLPFPYSVLQGGLAPLQCDALVQVVVTSSVSSIL